MKTVALCASVAFYQHAIELSTELEARGLKVILPSGAAKMRESGNFDVKSSKTWYDNPEDFHIKADLMREHFKSIEGCDVVLVINDEKHGFEGYIGPNVVMEMGVAFYLNKPVYILNPVEKEMPTYEEVMGVLPMLMNGDLEVLTA